MTAIFVLLQGFAGCSNTLISFPTLDFAMNAIYIYKQTV